MSAKTEKPEQIDYKAEYERLTTENAELTARANEMEKLARRFSQENQIIISGVNDALTEMKQNATRLHKYAVHLENSVNKSIADVESEGENEE